MNTAQALKFIKAKVDRKRHSRILPTLVDKGLVTRNGHTYSGTVETSQAIAVIAEINNSRI